MVSFMDVDLTTSLSTVRLKTPVVLAGGVISEELVYKALDLEVGAVTIGTVAASPKSFHPPPFLVRVSDIGFVNAYGIRKTADDIADFILKAKDKAERNNVKLVCSVIEDDTGKLVELVRKMDELGCDIVELNMSAPVIPNLLKQGLNLDLAKKIVHRASKATSKPLSVKLSPLIQDISGASKELVSAGARILHLINALSPALVIDIETGKPKLNTKLGLGALTGPAIKPIALAKVLQTAIELPATPIIGTGGITTWKDAIEMIMAGASAVGVHSVIYSRGLKAINEIVNGIKQFMEEKGYSSINELRGRTITHVLSNT